MSNQIETTIRIDYSGRDRVTALFRLILIVPALIFVGSFSPSDSGISWTWGHSHHDSKFQIATIAAGFLMAPPALSLLFLGVYPSWVLAYNKEFLALSTRVGAYASMLTDTYPTVEDHPVVTLTYPDIRGGAALSRWKPLVKWFLAIPLYIVGIAYAIYGIVMVVIAWASVVTTGTLPRDQANGILQVTQYWNRVMGYAVLLVTDEYPPFALSPKGSAQPIG